MNPSQTPQQGEVLKLGPPTSGEVIITIDPRATGATFAAGTQTLLPRAEIPVCRHLDRESVLFVHKGQGRALLNKQAMVVVPGTILRVPRGAWHGLRNTGTGKLQIVWASAPPGVEAFFRDLSRLGASPAARDFQELARRHGIELRPGTEAPARGAAPLPADHRRRRRRGGRRHRGEHGAAPSGVSEPTLATPAASTSPASAAAPAAPSAPAEGGGRRRRRGRRGGRERVSRAAQPAAPQPSSPQRRRRRVKEVYMGGRWVQIEGEGPVIAPGRQGPGRRGQKPDGDDEPPALPLSVPL